MAEAAGQHRREKASLGLKSENFRLFCPIWYGRPDFMELFVPFRPDRMFVRLATLGALAAALALSGCGRKGALDAPPSASASDRASVVGEQEEQQGYVERKGGARGLPIIRGPNKRIPLDALLD
jgi:predicted small lipoprotein YifL